MITTYLEAIREGLWEEMERDPNVFCIGEDIGEYGGAFKVTAGLLEHFGARRVVDTPISEAAIVGASIGAGLMGLRPVAEMQFADFISCGFDQIVNFAAKCRYRWNAGVPIVIRSPSGGGIHGGPFHSQNPEMWVVRTPGLKVVCPATAYDAKGLIKSAIRDNDPVLFFEHKGLYRKIKEDLPSEEYTVPIGKAKVVRPGRDLSIVTYGAMVWTALEAAETLAAEGCSAEVVDLRTLMPLDRETVCASVRKTSKALLLHEDTRTGGMAGELAATIAENVFEYLDGPILRVTAPDTPVPYSPPLEEAFLPNAEKVVERARAGRRRGTLWLRRRLPRRGRRGTIGARAGSGRRPRQSRRVHPDRIPHHPGRGRFRGRAIAGFASPPAAGTALPLERNRRPSRAARRPGDGHHRCRQCLGTGRGPLWPSLAVRRRGRPMFGKPEPGRRAGVRGVHRWRRDHGWHPRRLPDGGTRTRVAEARRDGTLLSGAGHRARQAGHYPGAQRRGRAAGRRQSARPDLRAVLQRSRCSAATGRARARRHPARPGAREVA